MQREELATGAPMRTLLICSLLLACRSTPPATQQPPSQQPPPAPAHEASVKPGINDSYFNDPDVKKWMERLEAEDREIFVRRDEVVARVGIKPSMVVADVGAGTGVFTLLFAKQARQVLAVDIMPEFLAHIRASAEAERMTNVETVLCREDDVALPEQSIDLAFLCDTYHHFEYPKSSLASIHRALRAGGELVLIDFIRIEGKSRDWILEHVRAGQETVTSEIQAAGFELVDTQSFLAENYFLRFRKT